MIQILFVQAMLFLLLINVTDGAEWKPEDMNSGKLPTTIEKFITADCDGTPCDDFKIAYFTSGPPRPGQKTILYIPGGPGQIVSRNQKVRDPMELESTFRIIYFDIRGAGLSAPQSGVDNSKDRFLRAKFIIKDIEAIRKEELQDSPWDAIYGHSAGTMFAQLYAEQFGKVTSTNPKVRVNTLILSAPISRHRDNEPFRAEKIATNLRNILTNNTDKACKTKKPASEALTDTLLRFIARMTRQLQALFFVQSKKAYEMTNNFCFLDSTRIRDIEAELLRKLKFAQEKYGSIVFVLENREDLAGDDTEGFQHEFPYPEQFFLALRKLDRQGSPMQNVSDLSSDARNIQVDAALVLGYYLDSPTAQDAKRMECNVKAKFFSTLFPEIAGVYCQRFDEILKEKLLGQRSKRAANVIGIHEGIHRWPVKLMGELPEQCDKGSQFLEFARSPAGDKRTARKLIAQVGFQIQNNICPWNPAKHQHSVRALILKGREDASVHGCQAEHFFKEGLLHADKEFVEFPDLGHDWIGEMKPEKKRELSTLLKKFIENSRDEVNTAIEGLGAKSRTVASFAASGC